MLDESVKAEAKKEALQELIAMMQSMMVGSDEETQEPEMEGSEPTGMEESEEGMPSEESLDSGMPSIEELAKKEMKKGSKIPLKGKSKMVVGISVKAPAMPFKKKIKNRY